jgi:hypothetical protein
MNATKEKPMSSSDEVRNFHLAINITVMLLVLVAGVMLNNISDTITASKQAIERISIRVEVQGRLLEDNIKVLNSHVEKPARLAHPPE